MSRSHFIWRIRWCIAVELLAFARIGYGDPGHPNAGERSLVFTAIWASALLAYGWIMYRRPFRSAGVDYVVLVGCLAALVFEVLWPIEALHNTHAGLIAGAVASATWLNLWLAMRRVRAHGTAEAT